MVRSCATLVLALSMYGCALSHERTALVHPTPAPTDTGPIAIADASVPIADSAPVVSVDAGSCQSYWRSLPSCPASTAGVVGETCEQEGATCGVHCCEPGPAIACSGGQWIAATPEDCSTVDCAGPTPCGGGSCAPGRLCVQTDELRTTGVGACVVPPAPIASCSAAPTGSLSTDTHTCFSCRCGDLATGPIITLSCDCCDL